MSLSDNSIWPRYFILLSYEGGSFHGWQRQPNAVSVQSVLEDALCKILRQDKVITVGCGRTDTGVHASCFYAHFNAQLEITDTAEVIFRLNQVLPQAIAVYDIFRVDDKCHSRFDARERSYQYFVHQVKSPFLFGRSMFYPHALEFDQMNLAAGLLIKKGDFSSFCKSGGGQKTNICEVRKAEWRMNDNGQWVFHITADRFLRNMVRAVVGTLIDVGRGKMSIEEMEKIIQLQQRCAAGESVHACGLYLTDVQYPYIKEGKYVGSREGI
jgi:tRNA pseudouridine38-40 synthase